MKPASRRLWRYVIAPALLVVGVLAIAAGLLEGPWLQPFFYGVF